MSVLYGWMAGGKRQVAGDGWQGAACWLRAAGKESKKAGEHRSKKDGEQESARARET